jgi:hypothetical protein
MILLDSVCSFRYTTVTKRGQNQPKGGTIDWVAHKPPFIYSELDYVIKL